jgi:hypothetical protein
MGQEQSMDEQHAFPLEPGEIIKIGGIPYRYVGDGKAVGATTPDYARGLRDAPRHTGAADTAAECAPSGEAS